MDQIFTMPYIRNHMQGLVASGGSLRVNTMARRPLGGAPKRRVHAKNMNQRRSSIESIKRKARAAAASGGAPAQPPPVTQWIPITPLNADDECYQLEKEDDLELLDASILEETQLDLRAPERSRTPEPLVCFANENKPPGPPSVPVYLKAPQRQQTRAYTEQVIAWTNEPSLGNEFDYDEEDGEYGGREDGVEEDIDSRFQAEAEELMNPNFENEYSEECMDSLQIYYSSKSSKAKSKRENSARFQAARQVIERRRSPPVSTAFRPTGRRSSPFQADDDDEADQGDEQQLHAVITKRLFPLSVSGDYAADDDPTQSSSVAAYEQWGRHAAHDDAMLLQLEDVSFDIDAAAGDNVEMRESAVSLSDSGILRALEEEADSSGDDDESESGDDYTSLSEYEAEENFYSDDSDFYEENDTQYSDDFEDGDAEVIEYANDEFSPDDSFDGDATAPLAQFSLVVPSAASAGGAGASRPALSLSPTGKKQQKPPTEVQWVMRNVAQSLLQASHDDLTVA